MITLNENDMVANVSDKIKVGDNVITIPLHQTQIVDGETVSLIP